MQNNFDKIIEQLNRSQLHRCENIRMGDVLYYNIKLNPNINWKDGAVSVLRAMAAMTTSRYCYRKKGNNVTTVAMYTNACGNREDHIKAFNDAIDIIDSCLKINIKKRSLNLRKLKFLADYLKWIYELKQAGLPFFQRLYMASDILCAYISYDELIYILTKEKIDIRNLILWCDVMSDDSFIVQKIKKKKVKTITLCHADFNVNDNAWAYKGSYSDAILVHSQHSKIGAEHVGCKGKIMIAGDPHNLSKTQRNEPDSFKTDVIGLVLNGSMCEEVNEDMINFLQQFCKKTNRKLIIKMHPSNCYEKIQRLVDGTVAELYYKDISINQFADLIDVAIISNSNVFGEMIYLWKPALLYAIRVDYHVCDDFKGIKFTNEAEFAGLIRDVTQNEYKNKLRACREFFVSNGNIADQYKMCYRELGIM